ncbi:MAG: NnrU family protein [Hydrogenophaga sp.]|nr:NnrU family protein [Hydrogenophaga sp.]
MTWLLLGLVLFIGIHSVAIVAPRGRHAIAHRMGEGPWKGLYTVVALAGFGLIVAGYSAARQDPVVLWVPPVAMRHVAALLMLPVFVLLLAAYLPGRIQRAARHPMLAATKFWALAHLLANGNLADVLLFGSFLAWAVADRISLKRRASAGLLRAVHGASPGPANDAIALVGGLALYAVFAFWAHGFLFDVRPFG